MSHPPKRVLQFFSQTKGYDNRDCTLERRLLESADCGDIIVVRKILKTKLVDINARDDFYTAAVSKAARGGHFAIVQMLIEAGCDVNTFNTLYVTPLHYAAQNNHGDVVKLLLLAGANHKAANKDGNVPLDFTRCNGETWQVLRDAAQGFMPEIVEVSEVPVIPAFAFEERTKPKKKKGKGKKGKKKGGKKKK